MTLLIILLTCCTSIGSHSILKRIFFSSLWALNTSTLILDNFSIDHLAGFHMFLAFRFITSVIPCFYSFCHYNIVPPNSHWFLFQWKMSTKVFVKRPGASPQRKSKSDSIQATGMRSKILRCQWQTVALIDWSQSERGNQRDGLSLAPENLATHSSHSNTVGFWFSSRASSGPFG